MNENVLLTWNSDSGVFVDTAKEMGVGFTGWSWNAHFADVDNDEWQDLFVVAGSWFRPRRRAPPQIFFRNEQGESFADVTDDYGFQNYMIVSAYTIVDFDRDGDLDFVTNSINGPLWLLKTTPAPVIASVLRSRMNLVIGMALAPSSLSATAKTTSASRSENSSREEVICHLMNPSPTLAWEAMSQWLKWRCVGRLGV